MSPAAATPAERPARRSGRARSWALSAIGIALVSLISVSCSSPDPVEPTPSPSASPQQELIVAVGDSTVSQIVANLYVGTLNANGQPARLAKPVRDSELAADVVSGDSDLAGAPISVATVQLLDSGKSGISAGNLATNLDEATADLRALASPKGLVLLDPADARVENSFVVDGVLAKAEGLVTISDVADRSQTKPVVLGGPASCETSPYCLAGLAETYSMKVRKFVELQSDPEVVAKALGTKMVDVAVMDSAIGTPKLLDLLALADDESLEPVGNVIPLMRQKSNSAAASDALNGLASVFTTRALQDLTASVDNSGEDPDRVADAWLALNGLA